MKRLAIITTHPIQYYAPLFKLLTERKNIELKVFYTWGEQAKAKVFDPGFGNQREWDIPLLEGYKYEFIKNISQAPGSNYFKGIINPEIIEQIEGYKPNALLVFGWAFHSHLKVLRYFKGKLPVYFRGDSTLLDEHLGFSVKKIARRFFLKWIYSHVDVAFYVGTNNKNYYLKHGLKKESLIYAPHAIDNDRFTKNDSIYLKQAEDWKAALGIPLNKVVVLFAGKLEHKKNPLLLVDAAKLLPELHFIIVGNGVQEQQVKEKASQENNISVLPFQNQSLMPVVFRLADIFVLPSSGPGETWGLALNEAMASGRAIIASNKCGGATDLIENGKNGFIIEPSLKGILHALKKILNKKTYLKDFKDASLEKISHFTYKHIASAIETKLAEDK